MSGTIGGVDASIPLQAGKGVQQPNPLQQIGDFARTAGALNALKLFPGQQELQQQAIQGGAVSLAQKINQAAYQQLVPLLAEPDITHDRLTSVLASIEANQGIPTHGVIQDIMATAPTGDGPEFNTKMRALISSRAQVAPESAVGMVTPRQGTIDTGLAVQPVNIAPPGAAQPGAVSPIGRPIDVYPPRSQQIQQVQYLDGKGVQQQTTLGEYNRRLGNGEQLGPANPVQSAPAATPSASGATAFPQGYTGRLSPPEGQQAGSIPGPTPTTVPVQQASGNQYIADRQSAATLGQRVFPLRQQVDLLNDTDTGPGSETANHFRSFLISAANQGLLPKAITPDAIQQAKFDELKKYMAQYVTGQPFASGSDARMAEMVSGSPNAQLSTLANRDVAKVLIGMERFRSAPYLAFEMQHKGNGEQAAGDYAKYAADFSKNYDPRAFAVDLMGGWKSPKVQEMYGKMPPPEQKKFVASLKLAYGIPGLMQ